MRLPELDALLTPLANALAEVGDTHRSIISMAWWEMPVPVELLPFHLHLRWPGRIAGLSANASVALVPSPDPDVLERARYKLGDAIEARRVARTQSFRQATSLSRSLVAADWESAAQDAEQRVSEYPANTYIAIDSVDAEGEVRRGSRTSLRGRHRKHGLRPAVLVPGRGPLTDSCADVLRECELVVVDAQRVRGLRRLEALRAIIDDKAKGFVLVVASSPTDLLTITRECQIWPTYRVITRGSVPSPPVVETVPVCRGRITIESSFEYATMREAGDPPVADRLIHLAKNAWWAACQSLSETLDDEPEVALLRAGLTQCARNEPDVARRYSHVLDVLLRVSDARAERRAAVIAAALRASRHGDVLVLTRNGRAAHLLAAAIAEALGVSSDDLVELGIRVQPFRWLPRERPAAVVSAGYFGPDTLDAMLGARPRHVTIVADPIEARAAAFAIAHLRQLLSLAGHRDAEPALEAFARSLSAAAAPSAPTASLDLDLVGRPSFGEPVMRGTANASAMDRVIIATTDGERIDTAASARFESLPPGKLRLVTKRATELEPGDRVALLISDVQSGFSDRMLAVLDAGPLRVDALAREEWLTIVKAVAEDSQLEVRHLVERLIASGHSVDRATVRAWISPQGEASTAPRHRATFHALAAALNLALPPSRLDRYFDAIRRWRTLHRKAGRTLARAIRAASLGRVDASATAQLRNEWGIEAEQLLLATRIVTVDDVFTGLPE